MGESEQAGGKEAQPQRRFSQEQYDMLLRCSKKKDPTEWNDWRKAHPDAEVLLEGAPLEGAHLEGVHLGGAHLRAAHLERAELGDIPLTPVLPCATDLEGADLMNAHLEDAGLYRAKLKGAFLMDAHLEGADLPYANLEGARLWGTHLDDADLGFANLRAAKMRGAILRKAELEGAILEGAQLWEAHLEGADFTAASVDGKTLLWDCDHDRQTNFTGVGLAGARVSPGLRPALEANVRRFYWRDRYKKHPVLLLAWPFWLMSDYGQSTIRVLVTFALSAFAFAYVYLLPWLGRSEGEARRGVPGATRLEQVAIPLCLFVLFGLAGSSLFVSARRDASRCWRRKCKLLRKRGRVRAWLSVVLEKILEKRWGRVAAFVVGLLAIVGVVGLLAFGLPHTPLADGELVMNLYVKDGVSAASVPLRAVYFSVVTMTTLGFGDVYAHPASLAGHFLLMAQVILGYVILGALVTRFAVLFRET